MLLKSGFHYGLHQFSRRLQCSAHTAAGCSLGHVSALQCRCTSLAPTGAVPTRLIRRCEATEKTLVNFLSSSAAAKQVKFSVSPHTMSHIRARATPLGSIIRSSKLLFRPGAYIMQTAQSRARNDARRGTGKEEIVPYPRSIFEARCLHL